jgi:hypothetical protein
MVSPSGVAILAQEGGLNSKPGLSVKLTRIYLKQSFNKLHNKAISEINQFLVKENLDEKI